MQDGTGAALSDEILSRERGGGLCYDQRSVCLSLFLFLACGLLQDANYGRLITKGYRMEKRLVAFDCRPLRFFCGKCEKPFSIDETERVHRQTGG